MNTREKTTTCWLAWLVVGALAGGCATSAARQGEASRSAGAPERPSDERAYRDAAMEFLRYLAAQRRAGASAIVPAAGKNNEIYPMYECMEYGCPDKVICPDIGAACHVTHCGKGVCHGCPEASPDAFKNLVFKQWCKFDCLKGSVRAGSALGFVSSIGNFFIGPFCLQE